MKWVKRTDTNNVLEIVTNRTGMNKDELLNDTKSYKINNLDKAVELYLTHLKKGSNIVWFTDYDADGINCANIAKTLSREIESPAKIIVPKRFSDGYGVKTRHVESFDCNLLVLADNGIAAIEPIARAKELGMDVIILDHHEAFVNTDGEVVLPEADVIVDPHVTGGDFTEYCGAGICLKFALEVLKKMPCISDAEKRVVFDKLLPFAAIGTIADVVSLTGENRRIVKAGIQNILAHKTTSGLQELLNNSGMSEYTTSSSMAYFLCPQFNAYGRLDDVGSAMVSMLTSFDGPMTDEMKRKVDLIKDKNEERKALAEQAFERAEMYIKEHNLDEAPFIVFVDEEGTIGINGLTSGKITEKYKRPSVVVSPISDSLLKGSGRSREWANLKQILDENNEFIEAYGGHPGACGITLTRESLTAFVEGVCESTPEIPDYEKQDVEYYDIDCPKTRILELAEVIERLEPYGEDNPELVVRIDNISVATNRYTRLHYRLMGSNNQHIKLEADDFSLVWWNGAEKYTKMGKPKKFSVLCTLGYNVWNGEKRVQGQIIDLIPKM